MKNQFSTKSEQMLREMTEKRIKASRSDFSNKRLHVGGTYYKIATVVSYIFVIYNLIMFLAQSFGAYEKSLNPYAYESYIVFYKNHLRICIIIVVLLGVALALLALKKRLISCGFSAACCIFYFFNAAFSKTIYNTQELTTFWLFVPAMIIMTVAAAYIIVTHILDYLEYKRAYTKLVDKILATYPAKEGEITTAAQWEEHIKQYNEPTVHKKPKKSLRNKKRKSESEVQDD